MTDAADGASRPTPLKGASSVSLQIRGTLLTSAAALPVVPIAFESELGSAEGYWAAGWGSLCFVLLLIGAILTIRGYRKQSAEIAAGYTVRNTIYVKNRDLFLLSKDLKVVRAQPSLPWRSLETDRLIAGFRGESTYAADESWVGIARSRSEVDQIERGAATHDPDTRSE